MEGPPLQPGPLFDLAREATRRIRAPLLLYGIVIVVLFVGLLRFGGNVPQGLMPLVWALPGVVVVIACLHLALEFRKLRAGRVPGAEAPPQPRPDTNAYLEGLREETSHIDIRGLQTESGKAHRFPIDELYIPLKTYAAAATGEQPGRPERLPADRRVSLDAALRHRRLVILGDPGAGKTTFLRRVAHGLCATRLGRGDRTTAETLGLPPDAFPLLISIASLADHVEACLANRAEDDPRAGRSPEWLAHYAAASHGLPQPFLEGLLGGGKAVVLLDGLDEAATDTQRRRVAALIDAAAKRYGTSRFVVASRPRGYEGRATLPGFSEVSIDDLDDESVEGFLDRWCRCLFGDNERQAARHKDELLRALRAKPEIRRMARNPVMLTALAVVHWNEKHLPEQRADLYESIIIWLARSRQDLSRRASPEECIGHLQELALLMQDHADGRQVRVPRRWAAEQLAGRFPGREGAQPEDLAEAFLEQEELDSGIIVKRGGDVQFWHLTFQEYLAARAVASRPDEAQKGLLYARPKLYHPEWREVVLLLGGVLHKHGREWKVNAFLTAVLGALGDAPSLSDEARCAGLLGAVFRDLAPAGYRPADERYEELLGRVMAIFDRHGAEQIDIKAAIDAAEALGQAGDPRFATEAARAKNWVAIPACEFPMGAQKAEPGEPNYDEWADDDEAPVRRVRLSAFEIGKYPVTVAEYSRFVDAGGYGSKEFWSAGGFGKSTEPQDWQEQLRHGNRPVVGVSWHEASAYAAWAGWSLPTEAQWECAARGTGGRRYPWGDEEPNPRLLNFVDSDTEGPTPVGVHALGASPEGVCDLAGNVWEWCQDWRGKYSEGDVVDPIGPGGGSDRVLRGGSWHDYARSVRAAFRYGHDPGNRLDFLGFRLARGQ